MHVHTRHFEVTNLNTFQLGNPDRYVYTVQKKKKKKTDGDVIHGFCYSKTQEHPIFRLCIDKKSLKMWLILGCYSISSEHSWHSGFRRFWKQKIWTVQTISEHLASLWGTAPRTSKVAYFVVYFKIMNIFLKNNMHFVEKFSKELKNSITI